MTPLTIKTAFLLSSFAFVAAACAVAPSPGAADDEATGTARSALCCRDCEDGCGSGGGEDPPEPPTPRPRPVPAPPPPPPPAPCPTEPWVASIPASADAVQCKAKPGRCFETISPEKCDVYNREALARALILPAAFEWLQTNGYCAMEGNGALVALCERGCFEAATAILTNGRGGNAEWTLAEAIASGGKVLSLVDTSELGAPTFQVRSVSHTTAGPEKPALFAFRLTNGRTLKVTQHHPMVLADGRVVSARRVKSVDSFLDLRGHVVGILAITREHTQKDVYNFTVDADSGVGHIVGAEGVLVGDLKLQKQVEREELELEARK